MRSIYVYSFFLIVILSSSCNDDELPNPNDLYGKWEAISFVSVESVTYPKMDDYNPTIQFHEDSTYGLRLDRNGCSGTYKFIENNEVEFDSAMCTLVCCDSDFSEKFATMIPSLTSFSIKNNSLKLHIKSWGYIELQRK